MLSQAVERWQARAIWVIASADASYLQQLRERLEDKAPALLYGCGDASLLATGGLAVVGSRNAAPPLLTYTGRIGQLAAQAGKTIVSGGARGIDQASMQGALEAGGKAMGVLADSLERAVLRREYRSPLMEGRLVLVSPYDPMAGFNVGNAMQRNKLIYALADAALVISSDYQKGGTWAGAVEQLTKLRLVPVYVRSRGELGQGLAELQRLGALPWPNPTKPAELVNTLVSGRKSSTTAQENAVIPALVHEASAEPPTEAVPAKRHTRSKKLAASTDEPTLFGAAPESQLSTKRTKRSGNVT
jgi:predicted Rossmann fold nucleotide-binding protein DprA/Smf involved in DNA uptake